jgi:IS5 family transposase
MKPKYIDLLKVTRKVLGSALLALNLLEKCSDIRTLGLIQDLKHYIALTERVINQTERRVIKGEKVPAAEKVFSIFEEHTDIIIKDKREEHYGHKICLTGGASNLILDCKILEGNPADSTLVKDMIERQQAIYGRPPLKAAFDGGFASETNLKIALSAGVKDVCFSKKRGLEVEDMCRSEYVYNRLRRFRAGIESGISWLKRSFGLTRCAWKGFESFKSYVLSAIVGANLLTIARKQLIAA